ncbi:MAG TPA: cytochrome c-type biogenesis protein CcmH [Gemmatimonadales bacterium]|nr:cytochrome c-type biogenesis protein CcmH [Gemmatimonadales bacterium]
MMTRRALLGVGIAAIVPGRLRGQDTTIAGGGGDTTTALADPLRNPFSVGRLRDSLTAADSDPILIATEKRLRCTCGCTLDVYTCRTTDFTCTYSPAMHTEIKALFADGKTPEQVIGVFVAREGEAILMAPPARGFNLAGYLVPGLVMAAGLLGLVAWIGRRRGAVAAAEGTTPVMTTAAITEPDAGARAALRRALEDIES